MKRRLSGRLGGLLTFAIICALVLSGLGWVTWAALRLEEKQETASRQAEHAEKLRLALWRLDSRLTPDLAREESRPYAHYEAFHAPVPALRKIGDVLVWQPAQVWLPSPLLTAQNPDWIALHVQLDPRGGWRSPRQLNDTQRRLLAEPPFDVSVEPLTKDQEVLLGELNRQYQPRKLIPNLTAFGCAPVLFEPASPRLLPTSQRELTHQEATGKTPSEQSLNYPSRQGPASNPPYSSRGQQGIEVSTPFSQQLSTGRGAANAPQPLTAGSPEANTDLRLRDQFGKTARGNNFDNTSRNEVRSGNAPWRDLLPCDDPRARAELSRNRPEGNLPPLVDDDRLKLLEEQVQRRPSPPALPVHLGEMQPIWLPAHAPPEHLVVLRVAQEAPLPRPPGLLTALGSVGTTAERFGTRCVYQGIVIDWPKLHRLLRESIRDLFPDARLLPIHGELLDRPELAMTALPIRLDPGPLPTVESLGWTPLRIGLAAAWAAALTALLAVGLVGWSLVDLSERRFRFVSAVTHELRTPLTTLRLYLDLLTSGLVRDEQHQAEYLTTLSGEADRLHRLIGNVLDFARLEKQTPQLDIRSHTARGILQEVEQTWAERCGASGKKLLVETDLADDQQVFLDGRLVQQILGNLIDNARKYSRDSADPTIWVRIKREKRSVLFEVADRGPGIPRRDRRSIFRPFRRGREADVTAGGVGLGLALARQWAGLLKGSVTLIPSAEGACFRVTIPQPS